MMQPRWQGDMYGSRNPVAMLVGTDGWGLFVASPWVQVDLREPDRGVFIPWKPTDADRAAWTERNQQQTSAKGLPPPDAVAGLSTFSSSTRASRRRMMKDFSTSPGPARCRPSGRSVTCSRTARSKTTRRCSTSSIPSARSRSRWTRWFTWERASRRRAGTSRSRRSSSIRRSSRAIPRTSCRHARPERQGGRAHGALGSRQDADAARQHPAGPGETLDASHILPYWKRHEPLIEAGVDAFWPDEGDRFIIYERITRHQMYYQGHLMTTPNVRPWTLNRNGVIGMASGARGCGRATRQSRGTRSRPDWVGLNTAEHHAVLGFGHGRLLPQQRADGRAVRALVSVLGVQRFVPLARAHVVDAPALGLGPERDGFPLRRATQRADPPDDRRKSCSRR